MKSKQKRITPNLLQNKKNKKQLDKFKLSLLACLVGVFLLPQVAYFSSISSEKIIELTNKERTKAGLSKLTANQLLAKAAYAKGQDILKTQSFQHNINGKKFSTWIKEAGYNYSYAGENLAIDFVTSEGAVEAWMKSPTHRSNIMSPDFTEIGIAAVEGEFNGQKSIIIVESFGNPPMTISRLDVPDEQNNQLASTGIQLNDNLLTHSIAKNQNIKLIPDITTKISTAEILTQNEIEFHIGNLYLESIITPLRFMPIAMGIAAILSMLYLYSTHLMGMFKLLAKNE